MLKNIDILLSELDEQKLMQLHKKLQSVPSNLSFEIEILNNIKDKNLKKQIISDLIKNGDIKTLNSSSMAIITLGVENISDLVEVTIKKVNLNVFIQC